MSIAPIPPCATRSCGSAAAAIVGGVAIVALGGGVALVGGVGHVGGVGGVVHVVLVGVAGVGVATEPL